MHDFRHERFHLLELRLHLLEHQIGLVFPLLFLFRLQRLLPSRLLSLGLLRRLPRSLLSLSREPVLLGLLRRLIRCARRAGGLGRALFALGRGGGLGDCRRRLGRHDHVVGRSRSRGRFAIRIVGGGLNLIAGGFGRRRSPVPRESRDAVGVGGCRLNGDELTLVATQPVHRSHGRKLQTPPRLPRRSESARAQCTLQPSPRVLLRPRGVHRALVGVRGVPRGVLDERVALVCSHVTAQTDGGDVVSRLWPLLALLWPFFGPSLLPGRDVEGLDRERVVAGLGREVLRLLEQPLLSVNLPAHGRLSYSQRRSLAVHASRGPAPAADVVGVRQPAHRDVVQGLVGR